MTTQTHQPPDLRPALVHGLDVLEALVAAVDDTDLPRPTPCSEYDVRALVEHLVMVARRIRIVLGGGHFTEALPPGAGTPAELRQAWATSLAELREALPAVDLGRLVTAPFGTVPGGAAVGSYTCEVTVHAWDLARALGRDDLLDHDLAGALLAPAQERLPRERDGLPFGEVVEVPDDAPAHERLVAWFGRDPRWTPDRR